MLESVIAVGCERPRITVERIAWTSIAWYNAFLTRTSLNGFFPLTSLYRSSGRCVSNARKMTRISPPSHTLNALSSRSFWMSCTGGSSTKSSSPERSAAMRVAWFAMGRYSIVSALPSSNPSFSPHQPGFFLKSVFTPGSYVTRR